MIIYNIVGDIMEKIKIHVLHTGEVRTSPYLPYGNGCSIIKASGFTTPKSKWIWMPVSVYLIEHPKGLILVDTGWNRDMSPNGEYDKKAQIKSLGSYILYLINQGKVEKGKAIDEQLNKMGIKASDIDYVLLTHLDCDHANGLKLVKDAKNILVSNDELSMLKKQSPVIKIRFQKKWWNGTKLKGFNYNDNEGPFGKAFDLFGDESIKMINIPGHSDGLCAVKIKNSEGKYVLLFSDGGYGEKSWREMITSGISMDKGKQKKSLAWIREQSLDKNCIESLANHDINIKEHIIAL